MKNKYDIVTSFNPEGLEVYARNMLNSFDKHWDKEIQLHAWYHDFDEGGAFFLRTEELEIPSKGVKYSNLNNIQDMLEYREGMKVHNGTEGGKIQYNWRLDAIKWCHKIYALTETAADPHVIQDKDWLIWLDADTVTFADVDAEFLDGICDNSYDIVHLGRNSVDYSETSFIAFNLKNRPAVDFLSDFRETYDNREVTAYREWHDGFIFERLLKLHQYHGLKALNLTPDVPDLNAFATSALSTKMQHFKGNLKTKDVSLEHHKRYKQLSEMITFYKCESLLETGTYNGGRAIQMADAAFEHTDKVTYTGYDLFGTTTPELNQLEFNSKATNTTEAVIERLTEYAMEKAKEGKTFEFKLIEGNTNQTLKDNPTADFVFIDGGHSYDTVSHDYKQLKHNKIVVLDDYFSKDEQDREPEEEHRGVNKLWTEQIKNREDAYVYVVPSNDPVMGGGITHLGVVVDLSLPKYKARVPIIVHPKDCMPSDDIQNNIKANLPKIDKWINSRCRINNEIIFVVSAGPSLDVDKVKEDKEMLEEANKVVKIVCVKHALPMLMDKGLIPWACTLLDPRPIEGVSTHGIVRSTLFDSISPRTNFLVASMTDPSVVDLLQEKDATIIGWHAFSEAVKGGIEGSGEDALMITGGTNAGLRTIGIGHTLGFREFHLYGFDMSLAGEPSEELQKGMDEEGKPKFLNVSVGDENYWTTGELLAGGQDLEKLFQTANEMDLILQFKGKGMGAKLWEIEKPAEMKGYASWGM
jgi:predicted O-methyltransferase YrrM